MPTARTILRARYRVEALDEQQEQARAHIDEVSEPFGAWSDFSEGKEAN